MKRKIIEIDEEKCNGCGQCITGCHEGALQLVNGKAKLVQDQYCDGLGDCIGECPTGALTIVEREADAFDEKLVQQHLAQPAGGGCPGSRIRTMDRESAAAAVAQTSSSHPQVLTPEIEQWPVMLHLVPPHAPFLKGKELVLLSTCSSVSCPDVQWRYIRGRSVVVACPKLDRKDGYVEKLTAILQSNPIQRVLVVRMEVPCCGGLAVMLNKAIAACGRPVEIVEVTIGVDGQVLSENIL